MKNCRKWFTIDTWKTFNIFEKLISILYMYTTYTQIEKMMGKSSEYGVRSGGGGSKVISY